MFANVLGLIGARSGEDIYEAAIDVGRPVARIRLRTVVGMGSRHRVLLRDTRQGRVVLQGLWEFGSFLRGKTSSKRLVHGITSLGDLAKNAAIDVGKELWHGFTSFFGIASSLQTDDWSGK